MANWKLRKDKTPAETLGAEAEAASLPEQHEAQQHETDPGNETSEPGFLGSAPLPAFDAEPDQFTDLDFDSDFEQPKPEPTEQGEGPLTLVDYTEPETEYSPLGNSAHGAQVFEAAPVPEAAPAFEAKPMFEAAPPVFEIPPVGTNHFGEDDFVGRLRTGRFEAGELAPPPETGFSGSGIPSVSPFVLDTPPAAAPPAAAPQLVVRFGRLSAAFAVTKDVTTIGRPDSALHYYPDVEIEMDDAVSRRHAEVVKRSDGYYIVDTGSTNGTLLNGQLLLAHAEHLLAHGDRIRVGERTEITFE
jgi:hypothetical protein